MPTNGRMRVQSTRSRVSAPAPEAPAAGRQAPARPRAPAPPPPSDADDEGAPLPALQLALREGVHNIKKIEEVANGVTQTRTTIKLAHVRGERFTKMKNPHETMTLESRHSKRFGAVVQGRGDSEFSYRRDSGGGSL